MVVSIAIFCRNGTKRCIKCGITVIGNSSKIRRSQCWL